MSQRVDEVMAAFDRRDGFRRAADRVVIETSPFDAELVVAESEGRLDFRVDVTFPSLDAVVLGETVPDVVLEGWAETLSLRAADAHKATDLTAAEYEIDWNRETVTVGITFDRPADAPPPVEAVTALVTFLEGTYLQGVIPGYAYGPPVNDMLSQARRQAGEDGIEPP